MDFASLLHAPITTSLDGCAVDLPPAVGSGGGGGGSSHSGPPTQSAVGDMAAPEGPPTQWRRRRRPVNAEPSDEEVDDDDNNSVVSGQWQPDAADVEMVTGFSLIEALPMGRMRVDSNRVVRRAKRMKVDLEASASLGETLGEAASVEGGMFAELSLVADKSPDQHAGGALLCFLSQETFVGFVELQHEARPPTDAADGVRPQTVARVIHGTAGRASALRLDGGRRAPPRCVTRGRSPTPFAPLRVCPPPRQPPPASPGPDAHAPVVPRECATSSS